MIRIGALNFSNALPLFLGLRENVIPHNVHISWGPPQYTNGLLQRGEVDIALISSADFLDNRFSYTLLSDLGIAATRDVMSVRLFYKQPQLLLDKKPVYVPTISATSTKLLKVLCRYFWKIHPIIVPCTATATDLFQQNDPFLLIGDACLQNIHTADFGSIDLAQAWNEATNKSFIFAVFATRNDALKAHPHEVMTFHHNIEKSFTWSRENPSLLIKAATALTGCSESMMRTYYSTLEYRFLSKHFHGLDYFSSLEI